VTFIAAVFFLAAAYLCILGCIMLISPGAVSMVLGTPLLHGLELAGPYMFLLPGAVGFLIGGGLLCLNRWARRAAILVALIGLVELVPTISTAVIEFRIGRLVWSGLGVVTRVLIAWYLYQEPVAQSFES
jgi:hypothetical protein